MNLKRFVLMCMTCLLLSSCVHTKYIYVEQEPYLFPELTDIADLEEYDFVSLLEEVLEYLPERMQAWYTEEIGTASIAFTLNMYIYTSQIIKERLWEIKVHEINGSYAQEKYDTEYLRYTTALDNINIAIDKIKPLLNE